MYFKHFDSELQYVHFVMRLLLFRLIYKVGYVMRKRVLCHMETTKVRFSLRIHTMDSMICLLAISKVSRFYLAYVAEQAGLNLTCSNIPEDMFSRDVAHISTN